MTAKIDYTLSTPGAFRGLYQTVAWGYVTNDTMSFQVPEAEYRAFGYEPAHEKLPWQEDYVGTKYSTTIETSVEPSKTLRYSTL